MASFESVLKNVVNLNLTVIESIEFATEEVRAYGEVYQRFVIKLHVRPYRRVQCLCPKCGRKCVRDGHKHGHESCWRAPDLNGTPVYLLYQPQRVLCPKHGALNERVPWADGSSRFTTDFNDEVTWLACQMSKCAVAAYLSINWRTVGNCIRACHRRLEPNVEARLHSGLTRICVDETSYRSGHNYITVVYDMVRNRVVWVHERHGKSVFSKFCELLTEKEREAIEVVAGDGARWIDECVSEYFPNATRCVDFFHVVGWANDALDDVRSALARKATAQYNRKKAEFEKAEREALEAVEAVLRAREQAGSELAAMPTRGRPSARKKELMAALAEMDEFVARCEQDGTLEALEKARRRGCGARLSEEHQRVLDDLERTAKVVKGSRHALGHSPENRTKNQDQMIELIEAEQPDLWCAYQLKERLRLILHLRDADEAAAQLDEWIIDASRCGIKAMEVLSEKICRHRQNILNSVRLQANSAKSESCNTTIKAMIKVARGFRNLDNMKSLIYLKCSDLVIPLRNRPQPSAERQQEMREQANERRRKREEEKRMRVSAA